MKRKTYHVLFDKLGAENIIMQSKGVQWKRFVIIDNRQSMEDHLIDSNVADYQEIISWSHCIQPQRGILLLIGYREKYHSCQFVVNYFNGKVLLINWLREINFYFNLSVSNYFLSCAWQSWTILLFLSFFSNLRSTDFCTQPLQSFLCVNSVINTFTLSPLWPRFESS